MVPTIFFFRVQILTVGHKHLNTSICSLAFQEFFFPVIHHHDHHSSSSWSSHCIGYLPETSALHRFSEQLIFLSCLPADVPCAQSFAESTECRWRLYLWSSNSSRALSVASSYMSTSSLYASVYSNLCTMFPQRLLLIQLLAILLLFCQVAICF